MDSQTISHYKIIEKLGGGGMGVVYKAEDTKLHRTVALKFLPPELTRDEESKQRFIQEAQAASSLQHNNVCNIHDIDETEDGQIFICMDCYEGETLKEKISKGPLKTEEAISIAIQIGEGLQKAHGHGIIHRDIKPANIFITKDGVAKILDFGLAKLSNRTLMTKAGTTMGTVAYMSPEQAKGEEVDNRTDIWSTGVVLFEMIAGQLPFKGDYEQAVIYSIINEKPKSIKDIKTDAPAQIDKIIQRMLEKDISKRYQSFDEIISELRKLHSQRTSNKNNERKNSYISWIVGSIIITAIMFLIYFFILRKPDTDIIKSVAVLPFIDMSPQKDQEYFCDGMTEDLINRLSKLQQLRVPARTSVFVFKGRTQDIKDIGEQLKVQAVLEGSVQKSGDRIRITAQLINIADGYHLWSEKYDRGLEDIFTIQDDISSSIVNALKLKLIPAELEKISEHTIDNVKAYECFLKAERQILRYDERSLDSAFVYLQTGIDIMGDNARLYAGMAYVYWQYTNMGLRQEESLNRMKEYAEKALALEPDNSSALAMLGMFYSYKDYPENIHLSTRYFKKALESNPFEIRALTVLAINYSMIGKPSGAIAFLNIMEQHDPLNPWHHLIRGTCYIYDCKFEPALKQALLYYQADSTSPMAQSEYSWALACNDRNDEALAVINRAGPGNTHNVQTVFYLLLKYALQKDVVSALRIITPEFKKTCLRDAEWSYTVAGRLSLAGAEKEALGWLYNAFSRGFINYPLYQCDPFLNNIRGNERFEKLIEKVKYEWEHFKVLE